MLHFTLLVESDNILLLKQHKEVDVSQNLILLQVDLIISCLIQWVCDIIVIVGLETGLQQNSL